MKTKLTAGLLGLIMTLCGDLWAQGVDPEIDALFKQVKKMKHENADESSVKRLLAAILERDPKNPRASWQLLFYRFPSLRGGAAELLDSAEDLAELGEPVTAISAEARRRGENDFAHFVVARYALAYRNFERAFAELEAAVRLKPDSVMYRYYQGKFLAEKGVWEKDDTTLLAGLAKLEESLADSLEHPSSEAFLAPDDYYFEMAWLNNDLQIPRPEKTIEYYQAAIRYTQNNDQQIAYAWHNMGNTYRNMQRCVEARDAAQKALAIMRFRAAEDSLQHSEFCIEMQEMEQHRTELTTVTKRHP